MPLTNVNGIEPEYTQKISFYITAEQELKLDDLAHDFRRAYGKRINRNDIVRHLLDQMTFESLEGLSK